MIKAFLTIIIAGILLIGCNQKPTPSTPAPLPTPALPEVTAPVAQPKGSMTSQAQEDIAIPAIKEGSQIPPQELLTYIQSAIITMYKNWVVLRNGTYIIFDNIDNISDVQKAAIDLIKRYQPKNIEESQWDFTISDLDKVEGWSVYGNGYGIYTYVHPQELNENPAPQEIGAYAKAKRALDEKNPEILFVSSQNGILTVNQ